MRTRQSLEAIATDVVDAAFHVHSDLGPGLLESVYEAVLARVLEQRGYHVERQKSIPIVYAGVKFDEGFRADILVEGRLLVELKSTEITRPVHKKQVLTYLRLLHLPLGILLNFGASHIRDGISRIVNDHVDTDGSTLRIHQTPP